MRRFSTAQEQHVFALPEKGECRRMCVMRMHGDIDLMAPGARRG
jgi:hypothetical protein